MGTEVLRVFFRSGMFIFGLGVILIFTVPRDSAEFVISVCSAAIGLTLLVLVALVSRLTR